MKSNLLLLAGLALLIGGLFMFSPALGVVTAGLALIGLSFAFATEDKPKPEDEHL